jgi:hypothetical protein
VRKELPRLTKHRGKEEKMGQMTGDQLDALKRALESLGREGGSTDVNFAHGIVEV